MIGKLISTGFEDVAEFHMVNVLHPDIDTDGDMYIGTMNGEQKLLMVKQRSMSNADGSEWVRPYQTKTALYYVDADSEDLKWSHYRDLD